MSKKSIGSHDLNHNGDYDFFDKMTDFYVYKKVSEYEPELPRPKPVPTSDYKDAGILAWIITILLNPVILLGIVGGILSALLSR